MAVAPDEGSDPVSFPAQHEIIEMHDAIISQYGGERGVLSMGGVGSAIERARFGPFDRGDMAERAAFLLRGIAQDHPFVDGNKRTAFAASDVFARRNGMRIEATDEEIVSFMLDVARGLVDVAGIASWLRARLRSL